MLLFGGMKLMSNEKSDGSPNEHADKPQTGIKPGGKQALYSEFAEARGDGEETGIESMAMSLAAGEGRRRI